MRKINFTKMVASGNDFIVVFDVQASGLSALARKMCDRKYGIGADGLLVLHKTKAADIEMRIFNADGSEAEMCGNGARCAALYASSVLNVQCSKKSLAIKTKAGIIESCVTRDSVRIRLTEPKDTRLNIPIKINNRILRVDFMNTGVPHVGIFVEGLDAIDVNGLGRAVRYHNAFAPRGTNVNFVEVLGKSLIRARTYERGVEGETLACGTGSAASALLFAVKTDCTSPVSVITQGGETLKVYFDRQNHVLRNVWLEGQAHLVYSGEYRAK